MRLLEYEAKKILTAHNISIPQGRLVKTPQTINLEFPVLLKAQIPLGGRGKSGGVLEADSREEADQRITDLLKTSIRGYRPTAVLIEEKVDIEQEFFMAVTYETVSKLPMALFSTQGGVDVEDMAAVNPERIRKRLFSARTGLLEHQARELISEMCLTGRLLLSLSRVLTDLAEVFLKYDCTIIEINPLALGRDGRVTALDCHVDLEDDALYRHPELAALAKNEGRYITEKKSSDFELKAAEIDNLDHRGVAGRVIEFDGNLGLIIGGGGASLTAFDAIRLHGGRPANYCEIGGNPSVRKVQALTKHILSKPGVEKISVITNVVSNTRVDLIARGIIKGVLESGREPSLAIAVFRVPGAWEEEGFKILRKYGVNYCDRTVSIDEAAGIAVRKTED